MCKWFGAFGVIRLVFLGRFAFNIWDIHLGVISERWNWLHRVSSDLPRRHKSEWLLRFCA